MNVVSKICLSWFIPTLLVLLSFSSCKKNKLEIVSETDFMSLPSLTAKDFNTTYTDSGSVLVVMRSPLLENYANVEPPYTEFKYGMDVFFYEGSEEPSASVSALYAIYHEEKKLWELRDSVIVENETKDKLETEQLFWDQEKDKIYTDRFVKITSVDQTVMGNGFESDTRLKKRKIKKVSAVLYVEEPEKGE